MRGVCARAHECGSTLPSLSDLDIFGNVLRLDLLVELLGGERLGVILQQPHARAAHSMHACTQTLWSGTAVRSRVQATEETSLRSQQSPPPTYKEVRLLDVAHDAIGVFPHLRHAAALVERPLGADHVREAASEGASEPRRLRMAK